MGQLLDSASGKIPTFAGIKTDLERALHARQVNNNYNFFLAGDMVNRIILFAQHFVRIKDHHFKISDDAQWMRCRNGIVYHDNTQLFTRASI